MTRKILAPLTAAAAVLLLAGCVPMSMPADASSRTDDASSTTRVSFADMMNSGKDVEATISRGDKINIIARKVSDDEWVRCAVVRGDATSISCDWGNPTKEKPEKFGR